VTRGFSAAVHTAILAIAVGCGAPDRDATTAETIASAVEAPNPKGGALASAQTSTTAAPLASPTAVVASSSSSSSAATVRPTLRYLALGDSFTIGTGSSEEQAFPAVFARTSGCDVTLKNVARNGFTTDDVLSKELPALASFGPDFVTLGIGANDFVQHHAEAAYVANVRRILDAILAAGVQPDRVVLVPQPDWSRSPAAKSFGTESEIRAHIEKMNGVLHEEGSKRGMRWLAIDPMLKEQADRRELAPDGLHPAASAHAAWAKALAREVCPAR